MKKKSILLAGICCLALGLSACGSSDGGSNNTNNDLTPTEPIVQDSNTTLTFAWTPEYEYTKVTHAPLGNYDRNNEESLVIENEKSYLDVSTIGDKFLTTEKDTPNAGDITEKHNLKGKLITSICKKSSVKDFEVEYKCTNSSKKNSKATISLNLIIGSDNFIGLNLKHTHTEGAETNIYSDIISHTNLYMLNDYNTTSGQWQVHTLNK